MINKYREKVMTSNLFFCVDCGASFFPFLTKILPQFAAIFVHNFLATKQQNLPWSFFYTFEVPPTGLYVQFSSTCTSTYDLPFLGYHLYRLKKKFTAKLNILQTDCRKISSAYKILPPQIKPWLQNTIMQGKV